MAEICRFGPTRQLVEALMVEAQAVAGHLGVEFRVPLQKRIEGAEAVWHHKTSMLQDLEAGRRLELDAILLVVIELAESVGVDVPCMNAVAACASLAGDRAYKLGG